MGDMILYRSGGGSGIGGGYPVGNVKNLVAIPADTSVTLTWTDPEDIVSETSGEVKWVSTRIVRKTGSAPTSEIDGTIVVESSVRNQYAQNGFVNTGLEESTTYYYAAFSCSDYGVYSRTPEVVSVTTVHYRIMTVQIDESDSNPITCCTYADDAITMVSGLDDNAIEEWQKFFRYRPCLVCGDEILGYLDPNDWTKYDDGSPSAYIDEVPLPSPDTYETCGLYHAGKQKMMHVFIEIPIMGIKISRIGNILSVSMTDNPNAEGYIYYPFYYNGSRHDYLYINSALGTLRKGEFSDKLIFDSPYNPHGFVYHDHCYSIIDESKSTYILPSIQNDLVGSSRYGIMSYYQYMLLQCMIILQCKRINNFDSIIDHIDEAGNSGNQPKHRATAGMFYKCGMYPVYDDYSNEYLRARWNGYTFFGIRCLVVDMWDMDTPNARFITVLDGIKHINKFNPTNVLYLCQNGSYGNSWETTDGYKQTEYEYTPGTYISEVAGSNDRGFFPSKTDGSSSTYYWGGYAYHDTMNDGELCIESAGSFSMTGSSPEAAGLFSLIGCSGTYAYVDIESIRTVFLK